MKKCISLLVLLFCLIGVQAQETHTIISSSTYNIRTSPGTDSEIVGTTDGLSSLEVYEIKDGWAKIKYGVDTAYVKSDCLEKQIYPESLDRKLSKAEHVEDTKWMVFACFCLCIFLAVMVIMRFQNETLKNTFYWLNLLAFNLLCAVEWMYLVATVDNEFMWILNGEIVGAMVIFNFIFFGILVVVQAISFFFTIMEFKYHYGAKFNLHFGLWSIPGVIIFAIVAGSLWGEKAVVTTILIFLLCQLIQILYIFKSVLSTGGLIPALISSFTYIVGFVTTLVVASLFFFILLLLYVFKNKSDIKEIHHYHY